MKSKTTIRKGCAVSAEGKSRSKHICASLRLFYHTLLLFFKTDFSQISTLILVYMREKPVESLLIVFRRENAGYHQCCYRSESESDD
jgi:hypothetical protein